MDPATIAALISGVSSMIGTGAAIGGTSATNKKSIAYAENENILQRQFAEHQAAVAYQRQLELWNKENAYNTPSAQMSRYIEAGLNPNLIYNNGQVPSPVPAVAPVGNTTSHVPQLSNPLSPENLSFARLAEAQIENLNADTSKKEADAGLSNKQAWQIDQLTDAQLNLIKAQAKSLEQLYDSREYQTNVEQLKLKFFVENRDVESGENSHIDENGNIVVDDVWTRSLRDLFYDNYVKELFASEAEYDIAIRSFLDRVGIIKENHDYLKLTNQDLQEFVNVCATIYQAQQKDAELAITLANGNNEFWSIFDGKSEAVKLIGGFLKIIAQGVMSGNFIRFGSRSRGSSGSRFDDFRPD